MSTMSDLDLQLQEISRCMEDEPPSVQVEEKIDRLTSALDELCLLAADQDMCGAFDRNSVGHLVQRSNRLMAILLANQPSKLRMIRNA